ncbi:hypothetical protein Angca_009263 [Angiostrongylus cantonensis]|nr:hypothetical protein Angca_009263 [Angiostrongylus cantonensis]
MGRGTPRASQAFHLLWSQQTGTRVAWENNITGSKQRFMSEVPSERVRCPRGPDESFTGAALTSGSEVDVQPVIFSQRWKVCNFLALLKLSKPGLCVRSCIFKHSSVPKARWQICLYPRGKRLENADNVSLYVQMNADRPHEEVIVKAECRFCFLKDDEEIEYISNNSCVFHVKPPYSLYSSCGFLNIPIMKACLYLLLADDSLVILCTLQALPAVGPESCRRVQLSTMPIMEVVEVAQSHTENELAMLTDPDHSQFSDLNVVARSGDDQVVVAVQKYKLITHSEVFRKILENNVRETERNGIVIEGFSAAAVKAMLIYIHSGSISLQNLEMKDISDLIKLAEKYNILALKTLSEQDLVTRVCSTNVIEYLEFAESHQANYLYEYCFDYMTKNRHEVFETEQWVAFVVRNPQLSTFTMERIIRSDLGLHQ